MREIELRDKVSIKELEQVFIGIQDFMLRIKKKRIDFKGRWYCYKLDVKVTSVTGPYADTAHFMVVNDRRKNH